MERLMRFGMSNGNMAGCGVALVVLALYLVGVIEDYWFGLAAIGYVAGFVAMYRPAPEQLPEGTNSADALTWLEAKALPRLTGEAEGLLRSILEVLKELSPRLKEMEAQGMVQAENRAKLKQLTNRYLPDALTGYFKLPSLYAKSARVVNGQTPYQMLVNQLHLLDDHVKELRSGVYSKDVDALLANGQFLKEKFDKPSFTLAR